MGPWRKRQNIEAEDMHWRDKAEREELERYGHQPLLALWKLVAQLYLTLCDPMNCSPSGFSAHGILLARILEWIAIPFSKGSFQPRDQTWISFTDSLPSELPGKPHYYTISMLWDVIKYITVKVQLHLKEKHPKPLLQHKQANSQ